MFAQVRDYLAGFVGVIETGGSFASQPTDDGNPAMAKNHKRVMRVTHNSGQLCFEDFVKQPDDCLSVKLFCHGAGNNKSRIE
jgi:hypothetical protein